MFSTLYWHFLKNICFDLQNLLFLKEIYLQGKYVISFLTISVPSVIKRKNLSEAKLQRKMYLDHRFVLWNILEYI